MSTTAQRVELYRVEPDLDEILVGRGVRGQTAESIARLIHWVRGRGRCVVPAHHPRYTVAAPTASTLRYFISSSGYQIARVWLFDVRASTKTARALFTVQAGSGPTSGPISRDGRSANALPFVYVETGATNDPTPAEVLAVITPSSGTIRVESVACYELPRAALERDIGPDFGVAINSFYPREDVWQQDTSGLYGLAQAIEATDTRRIGQIAMWRDDGFTTSSGTFVNICVGQRLLVAKDRTADTTRLLEGYVWAFCSNGTTSGEFVIRNRAGTNSTPVSIPLLTTSGAWFGPTELAFECEDLDEVDGVAGGVYDTCDFRFRRTAGAGSVTVRGYMGIEKFV